MPMKMTRKYMAKLGMQLSCSEVVWNGEPFFLPEGLFILIRVFLQNSEKK